MKLSSYLLLLIFSFIFVFTKTDNIDDEHDYDDNQDEDDQDSQSMPINDFNIDFFKEVSHELLINFLTILASLSLHHTFFSILITSLIVNCY